VEHLKKDKEELMRKNKNLGLEGKENDGILCNREDPGNAIGGTMRSPNFQNLFVDSALEAEINQKFQTFQSS